MKGFEVARGHYVQVTEEDLAGLAPRASRSIDLAWVNNPFRAQRLGKIYMRRNRGAQLVLPCKITALEACTAESVSVTIAPGATGLGPATSVAVASAMSAVAFAAP